MRWYADDSDIKTIKEVKIPNAVLFGGVVVSDENERPLRDAIESAKAKYGSGRAPIKWNFKDLKRKYEEQGKADLYKALSDNMHYLRRDIFDAVKNIDFKIIISMVVGHSTDKQYLSEIKDDLTRYVFSNGLMRFAHHVKEKRPTRAQVILDWPDGNNSKSFDKEYCSAYNNGVSVDGIQYYSGALNRLGFLDSALFTRMPHSTLLQFSDILVGTTREFVQNAIEQRDGGHGIKLLETISDKFRGYPNVVGRGLIVNSSAKNTTTQIRDKFRELYIDNS